MSIRKEQRFLFVFVIVFILCGCNSKKEVDEEVNYSVFTEEASHEDDYEDGHEHGHEDNDRLLYERNQAALSELSKLSESMEFAGTEGEFIIEPVGNAFENNKGFHEFTNFVCNDEQNQCVYYINYGNNDYIYRREDNKTMLLVEKQARSLQLWENKLYFVHATGEFMTGDAYCYDLSSKKLTKVIEGQIGKLYVDEDGIIFSEYEINEEEEKATYEMMKLNHGSVTPYHCDTYNLYKFKDFVLHFNELTGCVELKNRETEDVNSLFSYEYVTNYRVYGSYVIIKKVDIFLVINLSTGKKAIYDITQCDLPSSSFDVIDYIVKDHILYIAPTILDYIVTVDIESGTMKCLPNIERTSKEIDALYVAGDKIYAYLNMYGEGETTFSELIISDENYHYE